MTSKLQVYGELSDKEVVCMSIKPVDFQVLIPRSMEAAKMTNDEVQRNQLNQQQQAHATQHKAEDSVKLVYSRDRAQNAKITEKQNENRKDKDKRKKDENKQQGEAAKEAARGLKNSKYMPEGSRIDIKI